LKAEKRDLIGSDPNNQDYDITGAMYVNGDGNDIISMLMLLAGICLGY